MKYRVNDSFQISLDGETGFWVLIKINNKSNKYFFKEIRNSRDQRVLEIDADYFNELAKDGFKSVINLNLSDIKIVEHNKKSINDLVR